MTGTCASRSKRVAALAFLVVVAGVPVTAAAGGKDAPKSLTNTLTGPARDDFDAARTLFAHDDFAGAAIKFRSSYDRSHDARLLWNIASCEQRLKHYARSRSLLEKYLAEGGAALTDDDRRDAERVLATVAPFVTTVNLVVRPEGVEVVVDGEVMGTTPLPTPLYAELGKHEVVFRKQGYRQVARTVIGSGGDASVVSVQLEPQPHEGVLEVRAGPGEVISVDGESFGIGTASRTVRSGRHTIRVSARGQEPRRSEVVVEDDKSKSIDLRPPESSTSKSTWWLIGGGAVLLTAGAVIGGYFLFRPSSGSRAPQTPGTLGAVDLP